jgi:hypothetical protein
MFRKKRKVPSSVAHDGVTVGMKLTPLKVDLIRCSL